MSALLIIAIVLYVTGLIPTYRRALWWLTLDEDDRPQVEEVKKENSAVVAIMAILVFAVTLVWPVIALGWILKRRHGGLMANTYLALMKEPKLGRTPEQRERHRQEYLAKIEKEAGLEDSE